MKTKYFTCLLVTPALLAIFFFASISRATTNQKLVENHSSISGLLANNLSEKDNNSAPHMTAKLTFPIQGNELTKAIDNEFRLISEVNFDDDYDAPVVSSQAISDNSNNINLSGSRILGKIILDKLDVQNNHDIKGNLKVRLNDSAEINLPVEVWLRPLESLKDRVLVEIEIPRDKSQQHSTALGNSSYYFDFLGGLEADYGTGKPRMVFNVRNGDSLHINLIGKLYKIAE